MNTPRLPLAALILVLTGASMHAATLYSLSTTALDGSPGANTFLSANGTGGSLAYNSGAPNLVATLPGSGNYDQVIGNFAATTLTNIGDTITFSYNFTASSATLFAANDLTLRIGLFNSNGSPVTGNTAGSDPNVSGDTGYMAGYRGATGTNGNTNTFYQRTATNNVLFSTSAFSNSSSTFGGNTSPVLNSFGISASTLSGTGSFSITLISGGVRLTSIVNGVSQTLDDLSGVVTTFDEFGIFALSGSSSPTMTFSDFTIATVPEPSSLLLGIAGFGVLLGFQRLRSRAAR